MIPITFAFFGCLNLSLATYYWIVDKDDVNNWLFFLLVSIIMYLNVQEDKR